MQRRHFIQTALQTTAATIALPQVLPAVAQVRPTVGRKLALLVGVNDYSKGSVLEVSSLKGCVNDVQLLKNLLIYRYGFAPDDVVTLTDEQATRENILKNIEMHLLTANSEDIVVFSFSGHGAPLKDLYDDRPKARTTGLVPYNHQNNNKTGETNYITGTTLFLLRSAFKTPHVTFVLDCCYSGGSLRQVSRVRSVQRNIQDPDFRPNRAELDYQEQWMERLKLDRNTLNHNRNQQIGPKGVLFSASQPEQISQDSTFGDGFSAGAFTKFLTDALWEKAELPLNQLQDRVTQSLINIASYAEFAQRPAFIYPANQTELQSKTAFFTPAQFAKMPLQGSVLESNSKTRQLKLWLGGLSPRSLDIGAGAEFRLLTSKKREEQVIATLSQKLDLDFTTIATIPLGVPLPKAGTLLQQFYRPIPRDLQLNVGLDASLGSVNLSIGSRIKGIAAQKDGIFEGVDLILSQMTADYQQLNPKSADSIKVGTYGLLTRNFAVIPNSFGELGETAAGAISRLTPQFKLQLIRKLFGAMAITSQEVLSNLGNLTAQIRLKNSPTTILSQPNEIKQSVQTGQIIEVYVHNNNLEPLDAILIGISPSGSFFHQHFPSGSFSQSFQLDPKDGVGRSGEFMVLMSPAMLDGMNLQLNDLAAELSTIDNKIDGIFSSLKPSASRSLARPFVLSLPIEIAPKV
jgi:Caspase domain